MIKYFKNPDSKREQNCKYEYNRNKNNFHNILKQT